MKLYLLYNGVKVGMMSTAGSISPENFLKSSAELRAFFKQATRETILEVKIRPEAAETICKAIAAFNTAPVPLVSALAELLNFCRNGGCGAPPAGAVALPELHSTDLLNKPQRAML